MYNIFLKEPEMTDKTDTTDKKWKTLDMSDVLSMQEIMASDIFRQHIAEDAWTNQFVWNLKRQMRTNLRISEKQWIRFCRIHEDAHRRHNQRKQIHALRKVI